MRFVSCFRMMAMGLVLAQRVACAQDGLYEQIGTILDTTGYNHAQWGLLVADRKTGEVLYEHNADQLLNPASVTKLFTASAALVGLGSDFRFQTTVKRTKEVGSDGALLGDLILVASGDPSLGGRTGADARLLFTEIDHSHANERVDAQLVSADALAPLAGLDSLAREVASGGIKSINDVIVDDRLFEPAPSTHSGPLQVSPIVVNDNLVDVVVTPAEQIDAAASVRIVPVTSFVSIDAQVETVSPEGTASIQLVPLGPRRFQVRGRIPVGHAPVIRVYEIPTPADFARALFIETLRRQGIRVAGSPLDSNPGDRLPSRAEVLALAKVGQYTSPPLSEYVKVILKVSQDYHSDMLPMMLAVHAGHRTLDVGLRREAEILDQIGVPLAAVSFGGGAAGSDADLVTPRATAALLRGMDGRPEGAAFEAALPILGQDGTLTRLGDESSLSRRHVRAVPGSSWVVNALDGKAILTSQSLAGYMENASGRPLVFAFFVNRVPLNLPAAQVTEATRESGRLLSRLCEVVYSAPTSVPESSRATTGTAQETPAEDP